jgi:uncharacterized membrane-anchored protein
MRIRHVPEIGPRYWAGIALASVFGTNMGDFYAHESGFGLLGGLPILIAAFFAFFALEKFDRFSHEAWYWACIIVMRTGATNIADFCTERPEGSIDRTLLSALLALALAALAFRAFRAGGAGKRVAGAKVLPDTDATYWTAMLAAGVFGTVFGDLTTHLLGGGAAALALLAALIAALIACKNLPPPFGYWLAVAAARSAGTSIGDWLADNETLNLGLTAATLLSGLAFAGLLLLWRDRRPLPAPVSAE